jgi:hypothetical protein
MTKAELLDQLEALIASSPDEEGHMEADRLLVDYINDPEITAMYERISKWYA